MSFRRDTEDSFQMNRERQAHSLRIAASFLPTIRPEPSEDLEYLAKTSYTHKMNDLAQGLIRTFAIIFLS